MSNKYHARRTYSQLCERWFASKMECVRGEGLKALELYGVISDLKYQVRFILNGRPKVSIAIDFSYIADGKRVYEDTKGVLTRDFRTKLAWLKKQENVDVILSK